MTKQIVIEPITRIEGHGKITLFLNEDGNVTDAQFHVTQFRGFEKMCEGRPYYEMPSLVERICGICPIAHSLASAKACDAILGVRIPETAVKLRRLMSLASFVQSHALSFFHLSSPDLLLGMDADPAVRNIVGLIQANPSLALDGVRLRQFGQEIIQLLGKKKVHPAWVVPGGVNEPLTAERRDQILTKLPDALQTVQRTLGWFKGTIEKYQEEIRTFANFPTLFIGLVNEDGSWEDYDGTLRVVDPKGHIIADQLDPMRYYDHIGEAVESFSYMKFPYYKPLGYPEGIYRVGPLARLNVIDRVGTPLADQEWAEFRELGRGAILSSFHYHYARLIEALHCVERIEQLLNDPDILSPHVRAYAQPNHYEGVGVAEAPRGILIHHYKIDEQGLMTWANLVIATGHNNLAMNRGVLQVAKRFVNGKKITEGALNRVEAVIRTFDPCLSCATHALGQMPLHMELVGPDGTLLDEVKRG